MEANHSIQSMDNQKLIVVDGGTFSSTFYENYHFNPIKMI